MTDGIAKKIHQRPRQKHLHTILRAMDDPNLFGRWFKGQSWDPWRVFLASLFGLPMTPEELETFKACTGRSNAPDKPFTEAWLCIGRRGGKSQVLAFVATYLACFRDYGPYLAPGEKASIRVMAADRDQARSIFRFIGAMLKEIPLLEKLIVKETAESFELANRVIIEVGTASFRAARGYTFAAILADEIAFWRSEDSANPNSEVLAAIRPGMATIPFAMLLCASSPYARRGELWRAYDRWFGHDDAPALIWKAPTRVMNATVPADFIAEETNKDPAAAAAEYMAEFRSDVEDYLSVEAIRACIESGCHERAPTRQFRYWGFADASGGSNDSFSLAIAHREGNTVILDLIRERRPPFSPEAVVEEYAETLKRYRVTRVTGDRYAGEWPRERFRMYGINYEPSSETKSQLYQALLPLINSRGVDLLDNDRLLHQLVSLERHTARGGKDSIDHRRGAYDDVANAAAGAIILASTRPATWRAKTIFKLPEFSKAASSLGSDPTAWMRK